MKKESNTPPLDRLFYSAIHDIKEPVRRVQHSMEVLEAMEIPNDLCTNLIHESQKNLTYVYKLVNDLLLYARVHEAYPMTPVHLSEVLEMVLLNLKLLIDESNAYIHYTTLPPVTGNYTQLIRLFQNLIINAIRYNDKDHPEITVEGIKENDGWIIRVSDNGPGIKPVYLDRIFEPFKRLPEGNKIPGNGLGLAICLSIAKNHGGTISVRNSPESGAVFDVFLPDKKSI